MSYHIKLSYQYMQHSSNFDSQHTTLHNHYGDSVILRPIKAYYKNSDVVSVVTGQWSVWSVVSGQWSVA